MSRGGAFVSAGAARARFSGVRSATCARRGWVYAALRLPSTVAVTIDERTGATVYVIGCVHGSRASAADVTMTLAAVDPDAVVLELCESRFQALKKDVESEGDKMVAEEETVAKRGGPLKEVLRRFERIAGKFGGRGVAVLALLLSLVYKLQLLSGTLPGREFREAIALSNGARWRVVCGDAPATDTVRLLYNALTRPGMALRNASAAIAELVERLVWLPKGGVNLISVFFEGARAKEFLRLVLPALTISYIAVLGSNAATAAFGTPLAITGSVGDGKADALALLAAVWQTVFVTYSIVSTLYFIKVLIADRDRILSDSILDTASIVAKDRSTVAVDSKPVVASVVGLLHVNGILRCIQRANEENRKTSVLERTSASTDAPESPVTDVL